MWFSNKLSSYQRQNLAQYGYVKVSLKTAQTLLTDPNIWIVILRLGDEIIFHATINPTAFIQHVNTPLVNRKHKILKTDLPSINETDYMLAINKNTTYMTNCSNVIYQSFIDTGKSLESSTNAPLNRITTKQELNQFIKDCKEMEHDLFDV